jgi:hypothetical protein
MSTKTKRNFYAGGNSGDIEMPPLGYQLPDENSKPQQTDAVEAVSANQAFQVPDQVPQDVLDQVEQEVEDETEDESNQIESPQEEQQVAKVPVRAKEENFKAIREAKEKAERERDLLLSKLLEMQNAQSSQKVQPEIIEEPEQDFDFNVNDDDLLEGKHAKKIIAKMQKMEKALENYKNQSYNTSVEAKIKLNFPDFDQVVSHDNVAILNEQEPELAASLRDTKDIYTKAAAAYKAIKRMGIYKDESAFMKEKDIAIANSKKPRPLTSVSPQQGDSPLSKANAFANGLTSELKEQLRREMFNARKNH